jgi:hypothetical protein
VSGALFFTSLSSGCNNRKVLLLIFDSLVLKVIMLKERLGYPGFRTGTAIFLKVCLMLALLLSTLMAQVSTTSHVAWSPIRQEP